MARVWELSPIMMRPNLNDSSEMAKSKPASKPGQASQPSTVPAQNQGAKAGRLPLFRR